MLTLGISNDFLKEILLWPSTFLFSIVVGVVIIVVNILLLLLFINIIIRYIVILIGQGARCSSVVRVFVHGAMGHWIDPSWGGPIELFLIPASAPRMV